MCVENSDDFQEIADVPKVDDIAFVRRASKRRIQVWSRTASVPARDASLVHFATSVAKPLGNVGTRRFRNEFTSRG
jgi:hypothetical protein